MAEKKNLPSVQKLAIDAWELFTKTWVSYLKLVLIAIGYVFFAILVSILIILPISFVVTSSHSQLLSQLTPFNITMFILFILWTIAFLLSLIAIEIALPVASIFILQGKKASSVIDLIKGTKPFFWPYFFTMVISVFLIAGGIILLVIPGLLIAFFFSFVLYEVVIDGHKNTTALKHSYFMIKNNFWEVLLRLAILEIVVIIVTSILRKIAAGDLLLLLVQFLISLFAAWYSRAYTFLLYKEVRAKTTFPEKISINWIWVVSVLGWGIIVLLLASFAFGMTHLPANSQHSVSPGMV